MWDAPKLQSRLYEIRHFRGQTDNGNALGQQAVQLTQDLAFRKQRM